MIYKKITYYSYPKKKTNDETVSRVWELDFVASSDFSSPSSPCNKKKKTVPADNTENMMGRVGQAINMR
jgi:hypothetical protein